MSYPEQLVGRIIPLSSVWSQCILSRSYRADSKLNSTCKDRNLSRRPNQRDMKRNARKIKVNANSWRRRSFTLLETWKIVLKDKSIKYLKIPWKKSKKMLFNWFFLSTTEHMDASIRKDDQEEKKTSQWTSHVLKKQVPQRLKRD